MNNNTNTVRAHEDALRDARTIYDIACIRAEYDNATREDVEFKAIALRNYKFLASAPEQPAAVDEAMVERAAAAVMSAPPGISVEAYVRIVLEAALAQQG